MQHAVKPIHTSSAKSVIQNGWNDGNASSSVAMRIPKAQTCDAREAIESGENTGYRAAELIDVQRQTSDKSNKDRERSSEHAWGGHPRRWHAAAAYSSIVKFDSWSDSEPVS